MVDEEHFLHISHGTLEIMLQKKQDLNMKALDAVNAYVETEGKLLHLLIDLSREVKSGASASRIKEMRGEVERLVSMLDVLIMKSPEVKSKGPYLYLMETFNATENGVTAARLHYNKAISEFDTFIDMFPYNVVARIYGFKRERFFTAAEGAGKAPDIDRAGTVPIYGRSETES